jgi:cytochrome c-type biogenesis protein CcmH/NrfF
MYRALLLAALLTLPLPALAENAVKSQIEDSAVTMSRGELLYRNHCIECHNQQIHWRNVRIASDMHKLVAQVDRWQDAIGMQWTGEEIMDVSRYLNATYYFY